MTHEDRESLDLPRDDFRNPFGFTFDFGGSAIKILYTSEVDDKLRVHFVTLPIEKREEAFSLLAEKCSGKLEPGTEVFTCGVGTGVFLDELCQKLNVKITNTNEGDRMMEGFVYLSLHQPLHEFAIAASRKAVSDAIFIGSQRKMFMESAHTDGKLKIPSFREVTELESSNGVLQPAGGDTVQFPCLLTCVGSARGTFKMYRDGKYVVCNSSPVAGKTFMALGSLLSDVKTFEEMCELAGQGDITKVDTHLASVKFNPSDEYYGSISALSKSFKTFSFGEVVGKCRGDLDRADLALAILCMVADMIANVSYIEATLHRVPQVFFIGGFPCTNQLIRDHIATIFLAYRLASPNDHRCDCYFVRNGEHCGSIGALLKNLGEISKP